MLLIVQRVHTHEHRRTLTLAERDARWQTLRQNPASALKSGRSNTICALCGDGLQSRPWFSRKYSVRSLIHSGIYDINRQRHRRTEHEVRRDITPMLPLSRTRLALISLLFPLAEAALGAAGSEYLPRDSAWLIAENASRHLRDAAKYRFEMDNDIVFGSDNQFSNGWGFRIFSARANDWDSLQGPPAWILEFGKHFPGLDGANLNARTGFAVGQIINTPSDIKRTDLIENDVPYVGLLAGQMSWMAYSDVDLRAVEMTLGAIGPASLGEQGQNLIHTATGSDIAEGWGNQVGDEVVFNLNYVSKDKVVGGQHTDRNWDLAISRGWALGTIFTQVEAGVDLRFGRNLPGGFANTPQIMGRSISHDASLPPRQRDMSSLYGSLSFTVDYFFHHLLLDGSIFSRRHGEWVDRYHVIGTVNLGLHYERPTWATHLQWVNTTDTVRVESLPNNEDKMNRFLSVSVEWKIQ